jgi:hypothetical protein
MSQENRTDGRARRFAYLITHPLGVLWILCAACVVGAAVEWVVIGRSPWEAITAAVTIAGVIKLVAEVKGIPAWPLSRVETTGSEQAEH